MSGWPAAKLGDVAEFLDHLRRPVTQKDRVEGPYPYFGANGQQGTIDGFLFDEELLLLAEDGGHFENPSRGIAYTIAGKSWVNNHAHVLRPRDGVDLRYLCRVLENMDVRPFISGTTRAKLTKGSAAGIQVPLPPLAEQRRIAAILDHADTLRAKRREALARLDELTQSIFIDMFGDPATNPRAFQVGPLGDLVESAQYGTSEKSGATGQYAVLRMNNITYQGQMDLSDLKYMDLPDEKVDRFTVRSGDILFNRTNSAELVGKTAVYRASEPLVYAGYLVRLRLKNGNSPEYVSAVLNSTYGKAVLRGMCKSIVGMANINAREVQSIRILQPPSLLQSEFEHRVESIDAAKATHRAALTELDALFSSLQSRAFRGEL